jgi:phosphoserine phosphatase
MSSLVLVRPGSTTFDDEGRIKGCLDIPLSSNGELQAEQMAVELQNQFHPRQKIRTVYTAPCQSAQATAEKIAERLEAKVRIVSCLENLDHGLWQGKLIDEVRRLQPRLFKQIQDSPDAFAPPGGETVDAAANRIRKAMAKLLRRHARELIAVVMPDPLASIARQLLVAGELTDLWKAERDSCHWELIQVETRHLALV